MFNIPKIVPSNFISEIPNESVWENYIKNIEKKKNSVKLSYYPSPATGIVLTQACDIENKKVGTIIFAELKFSTIFSL